MNPLDEIEAHLVNASNALHELVGQRLKELPKASRQHYTSQLIDRALVEVQAWKEEEQGEDGDHD